MHLTFLNKLKITFKVGGYKQTKYVTITSNNMETGTSKLNISTLLCVKRSFWSN